MHSKESFKFFIQSWIDGIHAIVTRLQSVPVDTLHESDQRDLISAFMDHQELLFSTKGSLTSEDPVFGAHLPWINSFCRALQWYRGWRPTAAFRLAESSQMVPPEQVPAIEEMRVTTKAEEAALEQDASSVEIGIIKAVLNGGGMRSMDLTIKALFRRLAMSADMIRMDAIRRVVGMLPLAETIGYLLLLGKMEANFYGLDDDDDDDDDDGGCD
ncbi:transcription factor-like protein [Rhynchospora pubera]|uniref:Transcription factor-like protein n=1 Tax=Rhynchospora pubera TaxID=906938 RepID=A0AAV8C4L7_9POAL|nr:transcription factor-like protein [Rhynchospora pubera]